MFQDHRINFNTQVKENATPYLISVHYMAHRTNLAIDVLSKMYFVCRIEAILQSLYAFFVHNLKNILSLWSLQRHLLLNARSCYRMWRRVGSACWTLLSALCLSISPWLWRYILIHTRPRQLKTIWFYLVTLSLILVCHFYCPCWRLCTFLSNLHNVKMCSLLSLWTLWSLQRQSCSAYTLICTFVLKVLPLMPLILSSTIPINNYL